MGVKTSAESEGMEWMSFGGMKEARRRKRM
jgi:hypothetical protein